MFVATVPLNCRLPVDLRTAIDTIARAGAGHHRPNVQGLVTTLLREALDVRKKTAKKKTPARKPAKTTASKGK